MTMTTRKRHSPEQVVRKLATADQMLGEGKDVAGVCRELGVSEQTYYRWRNQFGGLKEHFEFAVLHQIASDDGAEDNGGQRRSG